MAETRKTKTAARAGTRRKSAAKQTAKKPAAKKSTKSTGKGSPPKATSRAAPKKERKTVQVEIPVDVDALQKNVALGAKRFNDAFKTLREQEPRIPRISEIERGVKKGITGIGKGIDALSPDTVRIVKTADIKKMIDDGVAQIDKSINQLNDTAAEAVIPNSGDVAELINGGVRQIDAAIDSVNDVLRDQGGNAANYLKGIVKFNMGIADTASRRLLTDFFRSEAKTRIYLYLKVNEKVTADQIIDGTNLHASTVRDALSEMAKNGFLIREKLPDETKPGKNPYIYSAVPTADLVKMQAQALEKKLSDVANIDASIDGGGGEISIPFTSIKIKVSRKR